MSIRRTFCGTLAVGFGMTFFSRYAGTTAVQDLVASIGFLFMAASMVLLIFLLRAERRKAQHSSVANPGKRLRAILG
ncbi:MAG: hypothetical protein AB1813_27135 [Verrucomicrobiota bacterium]